MSASTNNHSVNDQSPKQNDGSATAPYNFVAYDPEIIVPPCGDDPVTYSGILHCSLKALTPLLVGSKHSGGLKEPRRFFEIDGKPVIPGTSLKGMIRSVVETLSFSHMQPVSDKTIFWRDVTGNPKFSEYKRHFSSEPLGGWLVKEGSRYKLHKVRVTKSHRIGEDESVSDPSTEYATGPINGRKTVYRFAPRSEATSVEELDRNVVADFFLQMTDAQDKNWQEEKANLSSGGGRVFYIEDETGKVTAIGTARYFRVAYTRTPADLTGKAPDLDFATALFGKAVKNDAVKGRVSFSHAVFDSYQYMEPVTVVLGQPHPSCLLHYLEQPDADSMNNKFASLKNYSSGGAALRGRKYYWHRDFAPLPPPNDNENVPTCLVPMEQGAHATFAVRIERVNATELGALLEALALDEGLAHKLGMGKSMGMGSVRIEVKSVDVMPDKDRYASLSRRLSGIALSSDPELANRCRKAFREYLSSILKKPYEECDTVQDFLRMTDFEHKPANKLTLTMPLEDKENPDKPSFKTKSLLPKAQDVPLS